MKLGFDCSKREGREAFLVRLRLCKSARGMKLKLGFGIRTEKRERAVNFSDRSWRTSGCDMRAGRGVIVVRLG